MLSALHHIDVHAGDTVYVPAGLPHAIGAGVFLLELQQAADLSLLLEYAGFAIDGPRDGHLGIGFDAALACVRREALSADGLEDLCGTWDEEHIFPSAADQFFRAERIAGKVDTVLPPDFSVIIVTAGRGELAWTGPEGGILALRAGATIAVPFGAGPVDLRGDLELLRCRPPRADVSR